MYAAASVANLSFIRPGPTTSELPSPKQIRIPTRSSQPKNSRRSVEPLQSVLAPNDHKIRPCS